MNNSADGWLAVDDWAVARRLSSGLSAGDNTPIGGGLWPHAAAGMQTVVQPLGDPQAPGVALTP